MRMMQVFLTEFGTQFRKLNMAWASMATLFVNVAGALFMASLARAQIYWEFDHDKGAT